MALVQDSESVIAPAGTPGGCPADHGALAQQKARRPTPGGTAPLERDAAGTWHVRGFEEARTILRSNATRQAGFRAELLMQARGLTNRPILFQEGKTHQEQRVKTARFFTPKTVSANYRQLMERLSDQLVARVTRARPVDLSDLSLALAVQVAAQVVGLTDSPSAGLAHRLDVFFAQPTASSRFRALAWRHEIANLRRLLWFYWFDVRPAIRARRRQAREDVISHLLAQGYNAQEILIECVTYGAAGMATTREFIGMAAWHFLEHADLRARYLAAPEEERMAMLHEVLRLEPVVGHLFRRATADLPLTSAGQEVVIPAGALIDLDIEAANGDPRVVDPDARALCPGRPLHADRAGAMLLSFGDGAHHCPGAYIAVQETDIFLQRLLALEGLHIARPPVLTWHELIQTYELRRFMLALDPA